MYAYSDYPYASKRQITYARRGRVATSQHIAAGAGAGMFDLGGNAIDAAIATAVALTVVEPNMNGCGGDGFSIVHTKEGLFGLNSSGCAPIGISIEALRARGLKQIPALGVLPVTTPGVVAGWAALHGRFGRLPFETVLRPAINLAREGYVVTLKQERAFLSTAKMLMADGGREGIYKGWFSHFAPGGETPRAGEVLKRPEYARTLELIASSKGEEFYRGEIAERIDSFFREHEGYLSKADLDAHRAEFIDPVSVNYRGYDVFELPPNGQGIVALMALGIMRGFDPIERSSVRSLHQQIEAIKLAFADGRHYITDPAYMKAGVAEMLSDDYATQRRKLIGERAIEPTPGVLPQSGTVYLCTADDEDNMVSYIQSNYSGFGSGVVIPGTGIAMHCRGKDFSLDENHANALMPGKKTYHTIIPGFLMKDKKPVGPFGCMGAYMQPQGHFQIMQNFIDCGLNPQAALDAPRWRWQSGMNVQFEPEYPPYMIQGLIDQGHAAGYFQAADSYFGYAQFITKLETGALAGGTEGRADGAVIGR